MQHGTVFKSQGLAHCPPASPHRTPSACCCPGPAQRGGHVRARRAPAGLDPAPRAPRRPGAFQGCSPGRPLLRAVCPCGRLLACRSALAGTDAVGVCSGDAE